MTINLDRYPSVLVTKEMIEDSMERAPSITVHRTKASNLDTVYGIIGEYCFAVWLYGEWKPHSKLDTKGKIDFIGEIEVKTSAFPFSDKLNLLVRQDYASKRKPKYYVQTIIDIPNRALTEINAGMKCILSGFETSEAVDQAPLRDFGSKLGGAGGYKCRYIPISSLKPMHELKGLLSV